MYSHKDNYIDKIANGADPKDLEDELSAMMDEELLLAEEDRAIIDEFTKNKELEG